MGLLDKLNSGPTRNKQSLVNQTPPTRAGASPSSQLHSQGNNTEDFNPTTSKQTNATNLNFKTDVGQSKFDLDGLNPGLRAGALSTSQLHSQGSNTEAFNPSTTKPKDAVNLKFKTQAGHSQFDMDGNLPATGTYRDNAPENKQF